MRKTKHVLTTSERQEALQMYKDGATMAEVAEMFDVSRPCISRLVKQSGYDRVHKGGVISHTIELNPIDEPESPRIASQRNASLAFTKRMAVLEGLGTNFLYLVEDNASVVQFSNDEGSFAVPLDKLDDFIMELQGIQANLPNFKNEFELW